MNAIDHLLGQPESQTLEFKAPDVLRRLERVAREVVGMLNAHGGDIWIGIEEEEDRAVRATAIDDASAHRGRLLDHLLDTIQPRPLQSEVEVTVLPGAAQPGDLVRVRVCVPERSRLPFAQVLGQDWRFLKRQGDRLRGMSRADVAAAFRELSDDWADAADEGRARKRLTEGLESSGGDGLYLSATLCPRAELDWQSPPMQALLTDPAATGNRERGRNFLNPYLEPTSDERGSSLGHHDHVLLRVDNDGLAHLFVSLSNLAHARAPRHLEGLALLEHPVAFMRLVAAMVRLAPPHTARDQRRVFVDMRLSGVGGWKLRPYGDDRPGHFDFPGERSGDAPEVRLLDPLALDADAVRASPERFGLELGRRLYRAFGLRDDQLPDRADLVSGALSL